MDDWLQGFVNWFASFINDILQAFIGWVTDAVYYVFDSILTAFETLITAIPVPAAWTNLDPWAGFSPQTYYMLDKFNIGTCLTIVFAGWTIRWLLNFIPAAFTRV